MTLRSSKTSSRYVRTPIVPEAAQEYLDQKGIEFALVEDCCQAMLLIASDATINGKYTAAEGMPFSGLILR